MGNDSQRSRRRKSAIPDASPYPALFESPARALEQAHDLRKLEIELYWKRATYFWTIIAVTFAGFFYSPKERDPSDSIIIGCLGFLFSAGWYLVNRASGWAQRTWEVKVRLLEDTVVGPLHKSLVKDLGTSPRDLAGPHPYSITRLNVILSLSITCVWPLLITKELMQAKLEPEQVIISGVALVITLASLVLMIRYGGHSKRPVRNINYELIQYQCSESEAAPRPEHDVRRR